MKISKTRQPKNFCESCDAVRREPEYKKKTARRCANCDRLLCKFFFSADAAKGEGGRQSWCNRCKDEWEITVRGAWGRFSSYLEKHHPEYLDGIHGWTEERFNQKIRDCERRCLTCGAHLWEWLPKNSRPGIQDLWLKPGAYAVLKKNPRASYFPGNCQFACHPCAHVQKEKSPTWQAFVRETGHLVKEHGPGEVPWDRILGWPKRRVLRPFRDCLVEEPQLSLLDVLAEVPVL